ncbi:hypothetical protein OTU49_017501 [Cherax quadricarinatus]|uniref:Uncharacterized protein n=1 Tax=Cherax quadricarinatus TaxID=27406 RepID=A0AAW0VVW7_CHEQU
MRIHSCQIPKTSRSPSAVPPCKDHLHTSSSTFSTPAALPYKDNLDVSSVSTPVHSDTLLCKNLLDTSTHSAPAAPPCKDHLYTSTFSTSAAPPCKDDLYTSTLSTPEGPTYHQSSRRGIFSAEVTRNTQTHFKEPRQEDLNPGTIIVLDYAESMHPERKDPTHRIPCYPEGHHKGSEGASIPSKKELSTQTAQEHRPRVRHYRKRVCVRWGSLQWSLALVLVVKSRSSTRLYQHRYQNNNLTSYTPLTVL